MTTSGTVVHGPDRGSRQAAGIGPAGSTRPADVGAIATVPACSASPPRRFVMPEPYRRGRASQRPRLGFHTRV